jgi:hypothetical protein
MVLKFKRLLPFLILLVATRLTFGSTLEIISPADARSGDYIPVILRFVTANGTVDSTFTGTYRLRTSAGTLSQSSIKVFRGIGSITPKITVSQDFTLTVEGQSASRQVNYLSNPSLKTRQGTINASETWNSSQIIDITDDLSIPAGITITVQAGTRIQIAENANLLIQGKILVQGTQENPVHFTAKTWGKAWGGIELLENNQQSTFTYGFFTGGGGDAARSFVHSSSQPVLKADHSKLQVENCFFMDNEGKAMASLESTNTVSSCLFARCDTGCEFRFSNTVLSDTYVMFIPDEDRVIDDIDNDGIYVWSKKTTGGIRTQVLHCVVYATEDDGMDFNSQAKVDIRNCFVNDVNDKGFSAGNTSDLYIYGSVAVDCPQAGIGAKDKSTLKFENGTLVNNTIGAMGYEKYAGQGGGYITIKNSIISNSTDKPISEDDQSDVTVTYTLSDTQTISGTGNKTGSPKFKSASGLDFSLLTGSPAIDAGDPSSPADPDGTRADMGAYPFQQEVKEITGIVVNEIVSRFGTFLKDDKGNYTDWIELYNLNSTPVDVGGLYITDHLSAMDFFRIPTGSPAETTIAAHGYLILYADARPDLGPRHLDIQLASGGEEIGLSQKIGTEIIVLDAWSFPALETDQAYGRYPDGNGTLQKLAVPTPGSTNIDQLENLKGKLFINEFMARYPNSYPDEHGQYSDWIEIFNAGTKDYNLGGLYLSDNKTNPTQHLITPGLGDSTLIKAGGYFVFRADAKTKLGVNHLNFELAGAGENVTLVQMSGTEVVWLDSTSYGLQTTGVSLGRPEDGKSGWRQFWTPTPGRSNQLTAGTEQISLQAGLSVSPNPFDTEVYIQIPANGHTGIDIRIIDLTGRLIYSDRLETNGQQSIRYIWRGNGNKGFAVLPGTYILMIESPESQRAGTLLIKR